MLYIVATPIGNLEDITYRAVRILKEVDHIAAEDTRHSRILLEKYDIKTPTISFHSYSDERKLSQLIDKLKEGKSIALISDAGTPGISDPGYKLIVAAREEGIQVVPIPGPSAFLAALQASGLPTHQFLYLGFLPLKKGRQTLLQSLQEEQRTIIFYESPHRLVKTLAELHDYFGDRQLVIARELTKIHEEYFHGTSAQALQHFTGLNPEEVLGDSKAAKKALKSALQSSKRPKGEFVLMLTGG
ncbi:MAG: 16S rRNA (cytidine(1402)-2'-O)-methyltransferase [Candidatus Gracilibacteria bacterium]|nr:16S rRNA (cytidine(1402)-2'-O)-methyltransferase [Candidatus Peregrinibacteria bacterium]